MSDVDPCPYCEIAGDCPHLLLLVDKTFRTAIGGPLMRAFNDRWSTLCDDGGDDFDEREPFDDLLEEVNGLANYSNEYEIDGGPGSFSEYVIYFAKSEDLVSAAQQRFIANT